MADYEVSGRAAIVTGGGSGIGRAVARMLARGGAAVLVVDRAADSAKRVTAEIAEEGGTAREFVADVSDPDAVAAMVAAAGELGPLRIAVNNAGIVGEIRPVGEVPIDDWRRVIEVNLSSVFYCIRAEVPAMIAAGGGSIVNMASVLGGVGFANAAAYVSAKHGVVGLTKAAALEYAPSGVRVNAVGPGFITTPLLEANLGPEEIAFLGSQHAVGRMGTPEEVAGLVAFLAGDTATFVTGSFHLVDGGYAAR
jgi:NAD(P)-dependent dehydrogenase (short-subunit alcohol dehydrogenase family)